jgi:hypothetical protein
MTLGNQLDFLQQALLVEFGMAKGVFLFDLLVAGV